MANAQNASTKSIVGIKSDILKATMGLFDKLLKGFRKKEVGVEVGGFELLARLTGGQWSKTKMLQQYEKSLYVFACVNKIAKSTAAVDIDLFRIINSEGDIEEIMNHPLLDLIYKVNPYQTKSEFWEIVVINRLLAGDAFIYKVRNNVGQVVELWNLRPDFVTIVKDPEQFVKAYEFHKADGGKVIFEPEDIIHLRRPTPLDDYYGASPIKSAQTRIDTESYAGQFQRDFFLNNARPDAVLATDNNINPTQKKEIREAFEEKHLGLGKNSKLAILEAGLKYQQISISQREMDYIESMKFTRDDILVAFGMPKSVVAITDDVNLANAKAGMEIYQSEVVKPEVGSIVEYLNEMLVTPDFDEALFLDYDDPTPENRDQTIKEYDSGLIQGWLLINEVRQRENLPPIDGGWDLYKPLGVSPVGSLPEGKAKAMRIGAISKETQKRLIKEWEDHKASEDRNKKLRRFRGKFHLRLKLTIEKELKAKMAKKVDAMMEVKDEEQSNDDTGPHSMIKGVELREKYIDTVNKQIEQRADVLKGKVDGFMGKQKTDLQKLLIGMDLTKAVGKDSKKAISNFYKDQRSVSAEFILPFLQEYARTAGAEAMGMVNPDKGFELTPGILKALEARAKRFGLGVSNTTRDKITRAIADGLANSEGMVAISDRIAAVYDEFPTWRSDLIARTESTAANNDGFIEAFKQSDVATHKEWIATMDDRTREEHIALNGEIVPVESNFSNGLEYPQEPNCRCVIGPAFLD